MSVGPLSCIPPSWTCVINFQHKKTDHFRTDTVIYVDRYKLRIRRGWKILNLNYDSRDTKCFQHLSQFRSYQKKQMGSNKPVEIYFLTYKSFFLGVMSQKILRYPLYRVHLPHNKLAYSCYPDTRLNAAKKIKSVCVCFTVSQLQFPFMTLSWRWIVYLTIHDKDFPLKNKAHANALELLSHRPCTRSMSGWSNISTECAAYRQR